MINSTSEITLDQFDAKAAGLPDFAAQDIFTAMAANHEPANGLGMTLGNDFDAGALTNG